MVMFIWIKKSVSLQTLLLLPALTPKLACKGTT